MFVPAEVLPSIAAETVGSAVAAVVDSLDRQSPQPIPIAIADLAAVVAAELSDAATVLPTARRIAAASGEEVGNPSAPSPLASGRIVILAERLETRPAEVEPFQLKPDSAQRWEPSNQREAQRTGLRQPVPKERSQTAWVRRRPALSRMRQMASPYRQRSSESLDRFLALAYRS